MSLALVYIRTAITMVVIAKSDLKHGPHITSFNVHKNPIKKVLLLSLGFPCGFTVKRIHLPVQE